MNLTQEMISRSLYLESGLWKMIDEKAKEDERSGNKTISFILKNYFEKNKKHKTRAKTK